MKVVVVGCTHAGTSSVKTILNENPGAEVVVYVTTTYPSCLVGLRYTLVGL